MLDTDQLRSFLAIVDTGSFTRAADRVNKTQSAVSMHVRRLEERLDRPLFVKQGRGTRLSSDGERLVEHARRMLQVEAAAMADMTAKGLTGRVIFGIPDDYAEPFLPDIVTRFTRRHPQVDLSVLCYQSIEVAERIHTGELDVGVATDCAEIRGIESRLFLMSANYAAIAPIVQAGLALTVIPAASVNPATQRVLGPESGLPPLLPIRVGLLRGSSGHSEGAAALCEEIRASLGQGMAGQREAA